MTAYSHIIINNFVLLCKRAMQEVETETVKSAIHNMKLSSILNFRNRVQNLRNRIKNLIYQKIEFYSHLLPTVINYEKLCEVANSHLKLRNEITKELKELFEIGPNNIKLNREAAMFELCVLELRYVTKKTMSRYSEALMEMNNHKQSVNSLELQIYRKSFSLFASSNIVVFAKPIRGIYRIMDFTQNATDLFGVKKHALAGSYLTDYMTLDIAAEHDRIVTNYLNGSTQSKKNGRIATFCISKSTNLA